MINVNFFTEACILRLHCLPIFVLDLCHVIWLWRYFFEHSPKLILIKHIIVPLYQKQFAIVCIGAIHVFLVIQWYTWNKKAVYNFCWENLEVDQLNTIFQISAKVQPNGSLSLIYETFQKITVFNTKTLINFWNSLKNWLSEDLWCSSNKQKNLVRTQCDLPKWWIELAYLRSLKRALYLSYICWTLCDSKKHK